MKEKLPPTKFLDGIFAVSLVLVVIFLSTAHAEVPLTHEIPDDRLAQIEAKLDLLLTRTDPSEGEPEPGVNINTASYDDLLTIPGVGPITAGSIIAERGQNGTFSSWNDLTTRVSGVGPATVANMQAGGAVLE